MNKFNLTFRGDIIEGHDPAQAQARLAEMLGIDDPVRLQQYFSGDPVVLERNLERKEAAEMYARLRRAGLHAELVKVGERGDLHAGEGIKPATPTVTHTAPAPDAPSAPPHSSPSKAAANTSSGPAPNPPSRPAPNPQSRPAPSPAAAGAAQTLQKQQQAEAAIRRADLAAQKKLQEKDAALLKSKEHSLQKALRAKGREEAKQRKARARQLAKEAKNEARMKAAKRKAELAEKKRVAAEQAARQKAQEKQERAEAEARQRAELELARKEEARRQAERQRRKDEELALEAARRAEQEQARQAEQRRIDAEKAARREQEKRKAEQLAARLRVENARRKREQAEEAARRRAEDARKRAEEQARLRAEQEEQLAQRHAMEEQAISRAASELAQRPTLKPVDARVKTRLETPSLRRKSTGDDNTVRRNRQPGAPNLYSLSPFRNTPEIRARSEQSRVTARQAFTVAVIAMACALAIAARLWTLSPPQAPGGASAIVIAPQGRPLLLANDRLLLHDRAGLSLEGYSLDSLDLAALQGPLAFNGQGELLAPGRLADTQGTATQNNVPQLLRCRLEESRCAVFSAGLAGTRISALAIHPLDGSLFIADADAGQLLKVSATGTVLASRTATIPPQPVLRLDSGLLLMNSALGAGISVFRYEDDAFGEQLDEILLVPPAGEFGSVRDFIASGEHWWALVQQVGGEGTSLHRFDAQWQHTDSPALAAGSQPLRLASWGDRILALDPGRMPIQRFNGEGIAEAPLVSSALSELVASGERKANLTLLAWRIGLALCLLAAVAGYCAGGLHRVRSMVYKSCRERGAEPIDELAETIDWVETAGNRTARLERTGIAYGAFSAVMVLAAIATGVSALQLSALLLALAGPALALLLLHRGDPGHIGICDGQLLLVDHHEQYHLGSGARVHYRGPFLMIDDVTVFTGTRLLPVFAAATIEQRVRPIATSGVKVDRKIVTVKLLQSRHPLALGAVAILATAAGAIAVLSLHGIY